MCATRLAHFAMPMGGPKMEGQWRARLPLGFWLGYAWQYSRRTSVCVWTSLVRGVNSGGIKGGTKRTARPWLGRAQVHYKPAFTVPCSFSLAS